MDSNWVWSERIDPVLETGVELFAQGIHNWALPEQQAMIALSHLEELHVAVLGGDVYQMDNGQLRPVSDNWYCDRMPGEPEQEFVGRSIRKARDYISGYCGRTTAVPLFAIVPKI